MAFEEGDFDWEDLVYAISEAGVVPVVGNELWDIDVDGQQQKIEQYYLERLVEKLNLSGVETGGGLNQLTIDLLADVPLQKKERRKRRIVNNLVEVFEENPPPIPEALLKLAEIQHFELFLTTSFDTLLEQAIEQVRGAPCLTLANSLNAAIDDLSDVTLTPGQPCVYHLFGCMPRADFVGTEFAITGEDQLEYLQDISENNKKPMNLFDYLSEKELMFLGCGLPDGVARMMLRTLADCRLFPEKTFKYVESADVIDAPLRLFLAGLSGELVLSGGPTKFTGQMLEQWRDTVGETASRRVVATSAAGRQMQAMADEQHERGFIFISYRSEDKAAVQRLVATLETRMPVWWDDDMEPGLWERQLESKIQECVLFMPVLSRAGQAGGTVAKQEWNMALERRQRFSDDEPFLLPVIIDDLEERAERIPSKLWLEQCYRCPQGEMKDDVLGQVQQAYRNQIKSMGK